MYAPLSNKQHTTEQQQCLFVQAIGSCLFLVLIYKQPSLKLRIIDLRNLIVLIFLSFGTSF